jgi:hypothetical protein
MEARGLKALRTFWMLVCSVQIGIRQHRKLPQAGMEYRGGSHQPLGRTRRFKRGLRLFEVPSRDSWVKQLRPVGADGSRPGSE